MKDFGVDFIDGFFPALLNSQPSRTEVNRILKEIAFQAPFFRRFWLLLPPLAGRAAMCGEMDAIGMGGVGCSELRDGSLIVMRKAAAVM